VPQNSGIEFESILIPIKDNPDKNVGANVILINHPTTHPETKFNRGIKMIRATAPRIKNSISKIPSESCINYFSPLFLISVSASSSNTG
jgi:hypothetical protein